MNQRGGAVGTSAGGADGNGAGGTAEQPQPRKKFCGNITTFGQVRSDFINMWDQITPKNEGKWTSVEAKRDEMDWRGIDRADEYAKQHGIPFTQHHFVWGSQPPGWVAGLSQREQKAKVEEWIRAYCERYPDTPLIDVVNEPPPHTSPPYMAALGGSGTSGYDWIGAQSHAAHNLPTDTVKMYIDKLATSTTSSRRRPACPCTSPSRTSTWRMTPSKRRPVPRERKSRSTKPMPAQQ